MATEAIKVGFVGAGKMAQGLARGLINSGKFKPADLVASSPRKDGEILKQMAALGVHTTHDNGEVVHESDVVFLAVKPALVRAVVAEVAPVFNKEKLLVSIALGITTRDGDGDTVGDLLSSVGFSVEVPESLVDPVTGLSGSGPSYMLCAIEALADGGVKVGLETPSQALKLAAHTLVGAAKLVLETGKHPAQLKDDVQSPAGSSIYAMHQLERTAFRGSLMDAVEAACDRSKTTGESIYLQYDS